MTAFHSLLVPILLQERLAALDGVEQDAAAPAGAAGEEWSRLQERALRVAREIGGGPRWAGGGSYPEKPAERRLDRRF